MLDFDLAMLKPMPWSLGKYKTSQSSPLAIVLAAIWPQEPGNGWLEAHVQAIMVKH